VETFPIYVVSVDPTDGRPPEFSGSVAVGPHLIALSGKKRAVRQHVLDCLTAAYEDANKRIRAEYILFGAGALAGVATRETVEHVGGAEILRRAAGVQELPAQPDEKVIVAAKDIAIRGMFGSGERGVLSIWRILAGGLLYNGAGRVLDPNAILKSTCARKGTSDWGFGFGPEGHLPKESAFAAAGRLWPLAQPILRQAIDTETAAFEVASAAQILLGRVRSVLDPMTGAAYVMQGAIATALDGRRYRAVPLH
jgi:hypothetical protein